MKTPIEANFKLMGVAMFASLAGVLMAAGLEIFKIKKMHLLYV